MEYTLLIHKAEEGGFQAGVPTLPGCVSPGETVAETIANPKEAIGLHILFLKEKHEEIPRDEEFIISRIQEGSVAG